MKRILMFGMTAIMIITSLAGCYFSEREGRHGGDRGGWYDRDDRRDGGFNERGERRDGGFYERR